MSNLFKSRKDFVFLLLVGFILALIIFGPSLKGQWTLDDHPVIESRLEQFKFGNFPKLFFTSWHPAGEWAGNYRPLTLLSFALNAVISKKTFGFHLVNVFLHALNAVMIFGLMRRFWNRRTAIIAGILFLLLPIHTEAVVSVVGRVYLLGTFFSLATLYYFFEKKYWLSAGLFLAALLSGDFFISMAIILGILLLWETKSFWRSLVIGSRYGGSVALLFLFRYLALGRPYVFGGEGYVDPVIGHLAYVGFKERIFTALTHLFVYLRKTFIPVDLSPDYSFNQIPVVTSLLAWRSWLGTAVLVLIIFLVLSKRFSRGFIPSNSRFAAPTLSDLTGIKVGAILFLAAYLLMSNLAVVTTGTMAERWWYWPSVGLVMLLAAGVENFVLKNRRWKNWVWGLGSLVLIWYGWLSFQQSYAWQSDRHLFARASEYSPQSVWARTNLAEEFFASKDYGHAKTEVAKAILITDQNPLTLYVQAKINWQEGNIEAAEKGFLRAIEFDGRGRNKRSLYRMLALLNLDSGENKKAEGYMREAVKWPVARQKENIVEIDNYLVKFTQEMALRKPSSYTLKEKEDLIHMIKALRGF